MRTHYLLRKEHIYVAPSLSHVFHLRYPGNRFEADGLTYYCQHLVALSVGTYVNQVQGRCALSSHLHSELTWSSRARALSHCPALPHATIAALNVLTLGRTSAAAISPKRRRARCHCPALAQASAAALKHTTFGDTPSDRIWVE